MKPLEKTIRRLFRIASVRPDPSRDLDAELAFHFERTVEDLVAAGMSDREARAEARRRFGDERRYRRELEDIDRSRVAKERRHELLGTLGASLAYTLRGLARTPAFTLGVVLTLALGIGANATMFGVVDRLLLSPPPHVENAGEVRRLFVRRAGFNDRLFTSSTISYPDFTDFLESRTFESVAVYSSTRLTLGDGEGAARVRTLLASGSFFEVLGVKPALGRFFDQGDDTFQASQQVAVLSHGFWRRRFGADPRAIGRTLELGDARFTVVGVAPERFTGVDIAPVDVFVPLHARQSLDDNILWVENRNWFFLRAIARLADGVSVEAAEAEATRLHRSGRQEMVDAGEYGADAIVIAAPVIAARGPGASAESAVSRWLAAVALIVLLIACANVANLLLARGRKRRREIAIRLAMGISRRRLIGGLLLEALVLSLLGGLAALAVATWGAELMRTTLLPGVAWLESPTNGRVLAFTALAAIGAGLLAGAAPALQASGPNLTEALKAGVREGTIGRSRTRLALLVAQGALSALLLVGAGLFVKSLAKLESLDLGLDPEGVLVARLEFTGHPERAEAQRTYERALERTSALPGVEKAALAISTPFGGSQGASITVPGIDSVPKPASGGPYFNFVTPEYFAVMDLRILKGRALNADDVAGSRAVAVMEEDMARRLWPGEEALGKCFIPFGQEACIEVVGVVESARRQEVIEEEQWQFYLPMTQNPYPDVRARALAVRGTIAGGDLQKRLQRELQTALPGVRFAAVAPLASSVERQLRSWQLGATMFTVFGLLALVVAGVGLYAALSFNVSLRQHEMGVRSALGASRDRILALIMKEALFISATGLGLGLLIALFAGRFISPLLYDTSPKDASVLAGVILTLTLVALVAGIIPAWRATRADPNVALRVD